MDILEGRENLAGFYASQVRARADGTAIRIHIVGDSKVAGAGLDDGYRLDQLLQTMANGYPVVITFKPYGGENSYLWGHGGGVETFLAQNPGAQLLVVDKNTNENVVGAMGGAQSIAETIANHETAIAKIRAVRPPEELSILLLGGRPCSNDVPGYQQTTAAMVGVNAALRQVAQEHHAAFFDPLMLFQRAHGEAGWMDVLPSPPFTGGSVHPGKAMNMVMIGELGRRLFPLPYRLPQGVEGIFYPALQNGWWNHAPGYEVRAVLRADGEVRMRGMIRPGVVAANTVLFTLPPPYRPALNEYFCTSRSGLNDFALVRFLANGQVSIPAAFTGQWLAMGGLSFDTLV